MPDYVKGERIQVWSNSQSAWLDGTCEEFVTKSGIYDGYSVPAGAMKVKTSAGVKWIMPENVPTVVRKKDTCAPVDKGPGAGGSPSGVKLCKNGCGRVCQPGLTRGMKGYDTCCKRCALNPGEGKHDENCGGKELAPRPRKHTMKGGQAKQFVQELLIDSRKLSDVASKAFNSVAKSGKVSKKEVEPALREVLKQVLAEDEGVPLFPAGIFESCDGDKDGNLTSGEMADFLQKVLGSWFPQTLPVSTPSFVRKNPRTVEEVYKLGEKLGEGSFGIVYKAEHKISGQVRVCKRIRKTGKENIQEIMGEIETMAKLDHPNVIKVYEFFNDEKYVSQIMEPCNGGELQDRIDNVYRKGKPAFSEAFICDVIKQTLRALAFMHANRFVHKDLKPQNIMMVDDTSSSVKVIDFGLAELFDKGSEYARSVGGTLLYMAPEVFKREITFKVDIWATGVVMYNLITGEFPFQGTWPPPAGRDEKWWQEETIRKICTDPFPSHPRFSRFSPDLVNLMRQMLNRDMEARPGAAQCLDHQWFKRFSEEPAPLSIGVTQCLEAFSGQSELKKALFLLLAHQCAVPAMLELRQIFTHFDVRNNGCLDIDDLRDVLARAGYGDLGTDRVIHSLDRTMSGSVGWTEFVAAALCISLPRTGRHVDAAFAFFDQDSDGKISSTDMEAILAVGQHSRAWKDKMPDMFQDIVNGGGKKGFALNPIAAFTRFGGGAAAGSGEKVDKEQFRSFVTTNMNMTAGNRLAAVR
mmetsp:Transcript_2486/g.5432  ORF Transcript_2486/g.5432 Transcript_2486/m.5432 type:complete len:749 (-) Transcript_2486:70-2316(-)